MILHLPNLPQHFLTEIKKRGGGELSLEIKRRAGEAGGQSQEVEREIRRCARPHEVSSRFRRDYRSLSFLFPLVSPVTTSKSSPFSGLEPTRLLLLAGLPWMRQEIPHSLQGFISPRLGCAQVPSVNYLPFPFVLRTLSDPVHEGGQEPEIHPSGHWPVL